MSLGPLMIDIGGTELLAEEREMLRHPLVGGVILFTRNYVSSKQINDLICIIHELREPKLLVAVDHEGGRIQRFRDGFSALPAARRLGEIYAHDRHGAKHFAQISGWLMASELRAVGVDFSFAPVLDLHRGVSQVIGDRAFDADPGIVADLAHSYMIGMKRAGMEATGKHFPGHGAVAADSHLAVPIDERRYEDIYAEDIVPFERMIHFGLAAIMPAHIIYSKVDAEPAGFSRFWLQDVLRGRLDFQGVIFSDDLSMAGACVAGDIVARARSALDAGCDMALVCNNPAGAAQMLDGLGDYQQPVSYMRLVRMRGRGHIDHAQLTDSPGWRQAVSIIQQINDFDAGVENFRLI